MVHDAGNDRQAARQEARIRDGPKRAIVDAIAIVGPEGLALLVSQHGRKIPVAEALHGLANSCSRADVPERNHFHRQWERAQRIDEFALIGDHHQTRGRCRHDLLTQQSAAATLDEIQIAVGWVSAGVRLLPPPSGPGPVVADPGRRTTSNNDVRASGAQALFAMGDLNAPILQPWAREQMRQRNERVLAGKPAFSRQASCWPVGTPGFLLYAVQPVYFVQSPKEVVMIWQADHQVRHVYMNVHPS